MLKIHCWLVESHRNAVSGVVETIVSLTPPGVPFITVEAKDWTTPACAIDVPLASQTRNLAGTVLPCLNTLVPSKLIGCKIVWPASPLHVPAELAY